MTASAPAVGTRWTFGKRGATYEVVNEAAQRPEYVKVRRVNGAGVPTGNVLEARIASFGTAYVAAEAEA